MICAGRGRSAKQSRRRLLRRQRRPREKILTRQSDQRLVSSFSCNYCTRIRFRHACFPTIRSISTAAFDTIMYTICTTLWSVLSSSGLWQGNFPEGVQGCQSWFERSGSCKWRSLPSAADTRFILCTCMFCARRVGCAKCSPCWHFFCRWRRLVRRVVKSGSKCLTRLFSIFNPWVAVLWTLNKYKPWFSLWHTTFISCTCRRRLSSTKKPKPGRLATSKPWKITKTRTLQRFAMREWTLWTFIKWSECLME